MSNVSTKVTVSKEVAEAIEDARERFTDAEIVSAANGWNTYGEESLEHLHRWCHEDKTTGREDLIMRALVNGYEIEKSPEEKLREYYESIKELSEKAHAEADHDSESEMISELLGIKTTLDLLGITIEGIND